jgi:hypothetical protein
MTRKSRRSPVEELAIRFGRSLHPPILLDLRRNREFCRIAQRSPRILPSSEIDDWIDSRRYVTPVGGEIVVESDESFDYPADVASDSEMAGLHGALSVVLESYRRYPGRRETFRQELVNAIEHADSEDALGKLIDSLPILGS